MLLGIDIGSGSTKGVLTTPKGEIVATATRDHDLGNPAPGRFEHDPEAVWWSDVTEIAAELLGEASEPVQGLSVSGIGACTLPADADGEPVRDAILYGIDTRAGEEIDELAERFGEDAILERTMSGLSHQSIGPKLLWIRRNEPDVWERTRRLLMPNSFVVHRLTGEYVLDSISATMCTPMFDPRERRWIEEWSEDVAPGLELPRILEPWEAAGTITADAAEATGLPEGIPVCAGTIDALVESASVGVRDPGDVMLTYGTTMGISGVAAELSPSRQLNSFPGVFPDTAIKIGPTATSGALTDWVKDLVGADSYEELLDEAAEVPAGADGLLALPYFAGERTPIWDPDARGLVVGLTVDHRRGHLYRAMLEATAFSCRHILGTLEDEGVEIERIVAVGGGTKGSLWPQIVSDVTGRAQELPAVTIGAAYGDALFAARAAGLVDDHETWAEIEQVVEPDPSAKERHDEMFELYTSLYDATASTMHALAAIQRDGGVG